MPQPEDVYVPVSMWVSMNGVVCIWCASGCMFLKRVLLSLVIMAAMHVLPREQMVHCVTFCVFTENRQGGHSPHIHCCNNTSKPL